MVSGAAIVLLWIPLGLAGAAFIVIAAAPPAWLAAHSQQNNSSAAQSRGQVAPDDAGGVFVFKKKVEEVVLHASVVDNKNRMVMDLGRDAFTVYENNKPQTVISFRREDAPVAMGIVIDNSGSMREKRDKVNTAALDLVLSSNPQDRVFVVNFNDEPYLDQDFTSDIGLLKHALERVDARGNTALYDAVVGAAERLELAQLSKKVLFVVTDGEDNTSRHSLTQAVRSLQKENGPIVYAIGLLGGETAERRATRALQTIALGTGGIAFMPSTLDQVDQISRSVAHDIRSQYTLAYKPSIPESMGGYRAVRMEVRASGYGALTVRTRSGYYAGQGAPSREAEITFGSTS